MTLPRAKRLEGVMTMRHGTAVLVLDPYASPLPRLEELGHALARLNRFNGHLLQNVDVATHSMALYRVVPPPLKLRALLHDASEAVLGDLIRPLKATEPMSAYRELEFKWQARIYCDIGHEQLIPWEPDSMDPPEVCKYDAAIVRFEAREFGTPEFWASVGALTDEWPDLDADEEEYVHSCYTTCRRMSDSTRAMEWVRMVEACRTHPEYCH